MRRFTLIISALFLSVLLCACSGAEDSSSVVPNAPEQESKDVSEQVSEQMSETVSESSDTSDGESDESSNDPLTAPENALYSFYAGENLVYLAENADSELTLTLWIKYKNGEAVDIHTDSRMYIIKAKASPDGKKILFSNYEWECGATVFLYDAESRVKTELEIAGIPEGHVPYYLDWVDNKYFMFTEIYDSGTVAIGGEVYVYDIESGSDTARKVIAAENDRLQIMSFERDGDSFVIKAGYYDEAYNEYETLLYTVPVSEIEASIEGGEMTLLAKDGTKADE